MSRPFSKASRKAAFSSHPQALILQEDVRIKSFLLISSNLASNGGLSSHKAWSPWLTLREHPRATSQGTRPTLPRAGEPMPNPRAPDGHGLEAVWNEPPPWVEAPPQAGHGGRPNTRPSALPGNPRGMNNTCAPITCCHRPRPAHPQAQRQPADSPDPSLWSCRPGSPSTAAATTPRAGDPSAKGQSELRGFSAENTLTSKPVA